MDSNSYVLGISIPTFRRKKEFERLVKKCKSELSILSARQRKQVKILILENPSDQTEEKLKLVNELKIAGNNLSFKVNKKNIGGDANIEQGYCSHKNAKYTWVIGDDETFQDEGLLTVLKALERSRNTALFLATDTSYRINKNILRKNTWVNYAEFAKCAAQHQPHIMIAHTLVSANIIRTEIFDKAASIHERTIVSDRHQDPMGYCHMKGILSGLSKTKEKCSISIISKPSIDTSKRPGPNDTVSFHNRKNFDKLYRRHFSWMSSEFGIDIRNTMGWDGMTFLMPSAKATIFNIFFFLKLELRNTLSSIKKILLNFLRNSFGRKSKVKFES